MNSSTISGRQCAFPQLVFLPSDDERVIQNRCVHSATHPSVGRFNTLPLHPPNLFLHLDGQVDIPLPRLEDLRRQASLDSQQGLRIIDRTSFHIGHYNRGYSNNLDRPEREQSPQEPVKKPRNSKSLLGGFKRRSTRKRMVKVLNGDHSTRKKQVPRSTSALSEADVRYICRDGALDWWPSHWEPDFIQYPVEIDGKNFYIVKLADPGKIGIPKGCLIDGSVFKRIFPHLVVDGLAKMSVEDRQVERVVGTCDDELNKFINEHGVLMEWPNCIAADHVELEGVHKRHGDVFLVAVKPDGSLAQPRKLVVAADAFKTSHVTLVADYYESLLRSLKF